EVPDAAPHEELRRLLREVRGRLNGVVARQLAGCVGKRADEERLWLERRGGRPGALERAGGDEPIAALGGRLGVLAFGRRGLGVDREEDGGQQSRRAP